MIKILTDFFIIGASSDSQTDIKTEKLEKASIKCRISIFWAINQTLKSVLKMYVLYSRCIPR